MLALETTIKLTAAAVFLVEGVSIEGEPINGHLTTFGALGEGTSVGVVLRVSTWATCVRTSSGWKVGITVALSIHRSPKYFSNTATDVAATR